MNKQYLSINELIKIDNTFDYTMENGNTLLHTERENVFHKLVKFENGYEMSKLAHYDKNTNEIFILYRLGINGNSYMYTIRGTMKLAEPLNYYYNSLYNLSTLIENNYNFFDVEIKKEKTGSNKYNYITSRCFCSQFDKF